MNEISPNEEQRAGAQFEELIMLALHCFALCRDTNDYINTFYLSDVFEKCGADGDLFSQPLRYGGGEFVRSIDVFPHASVLREGSRPVYDNIPCSDLTELDNPCCCIPAHRYNQVLDGVWIIERKGPLPPFVKKFIAVCVQAKEWTVSSANQRDMIAKWRKNRNTFGMRYVAENGIVTRRYLPYQKETHRLDKFHETHDIVYLLATVNSVVENVQLESNEALLSLQHMASTWCPSIGYSGSVLAVGVHPGAL